MALIPAVALVHLEAQLPVRSWLTTRVSRNVREVSVTGHVDGLTGDPARGYVIATSNEDGNSTFNLIYPLIGAVATYTYQPSPAFQGVGGTDSVAIINGRILISHSNPANTAQATLYYATLNQQKLIAHLTPVYYDDSHAVVVNNGSKIQMARLTPTRTISCQRRVLISPVISWRTSQADGVLVFASGLPSTPSVHPGHERQRSGKQATN